MKVVGGTPQMTSDKFTKGGSQHQRQVNHTSNQSKQYLSSIDRSQAKQSKNLGMSGNSLQAFYASASGGQKTYLKGGAPVNTSIENRRNNLTGSSLNDKSRDFDNMQTIMHDQQRKLIRDNYLQGFQTNQTLGYSSTLENSRSAANYQRQGSNQQHG